MTTKKDSQHILGLVMLSLVSLVWGAGFVLNKELLTISFTPAPILINVFRFVGATLALAIVFGKKLRINKRNLICGVVGGILLFGGFTLQVIGLQYTTPAHCGFFTASYVVFTPFIAWMVNKKRPSYVTFIGVGVALAGMLLLNVQTSNVPASNVLLGDLLSILGALCFALQIVWADSCLKTNKTDHINLTFWQIGFAACLFAVYSLIFESKNYASLQINWDACWWRLLLVTLGGTAFAYYAQTFAQKHINATETSLIMACESPLGALLSIVAKTDVFYWTIPVGGALVLLAVVLVEVVPSMLEKRKQNKTE